MVNWPMFLVFALGVGLVTWLGLQAARWRTGDLNRLQEWGLAGRRFGPLMSWFLMGADVYTSYSFIAVPALLFGGGAIGFFAIPYSTLAYPLFMFVFPRFWTVAKHRGYVTAADFVRERFDSRGLSLAVALTGILATMPYLALQLYGIEVLIAQMGIPIGASLVLAFLSMAIYTFVSGLRAPAILALVKDVCIWLVVPVALTLIVARLGGFGAIFSRLPSEKLLLSQGQYSSYSSLALGSALAVFLYPHAITGLLSSSSRQAVRRNAVLLPAYSVLLGIIALFGPIAIAAGIAPGPVYKANSILPALFAEMLPTWFAGFAFATLAIGALVPSAIMSIAAANLFTRNIYPYLRPTCSEREEVISARLASLVVKGGALAFLALLPSAFAINLQLVGGIWILQTLPAVLLGLYTTWFHRRALLVGWAAGMSAGTWMAFSLHFASSLFPISFGGGTIPLYAAFLALVVNLVLSGVLTPFFRLMGITEGEDQTSPGDYDPRPVVITLPQLALASDGPRDLPPVASSQSDLGGSQEYTWSKKEEV